MNPRNRLHVATIYVSRNDGDVENNVLVEGNAAAVASALRMVRRRNPVAFSRAVVVRQPYAVDATPEQQERGLDESEPAYFSAEEFMRSMDDAPVRRA